MIDLLVCYILFLCLGYCIIKFIIFLWKAWFFSTICYYYTNDVEAYIDTGKYSRQPLEFCHNGKHYTIEVHNKAMQIEAISCWYVDQETVYINDYPAVSFIKIEGFPNKRIIEFNSDLNRDQVCKILKLARKEMHKILERRAKEREIDLLNERNDQK